MKIFISYCHKQAAWVQDTLLPILDASGHEALIDRRRFTADERLLTQINNLQDQADHQLLLLSPDYLASKNCWYEMSCALGRKLTIAKLAPCDVPTEFNNPLYLDFTIPDQAGQWDLFARTFEINWPVSLHTWITTRKGILAHLSDRESVNLIASDRKARQLMLDSLLRETQLALGCVDFDDGQTTTIEGAAQAILAAARLNAPVIQAQQALMVLSQLMRANSKPSYQIWLHFDNAMARAQESPGQHLFGRDFFSAIRNLTTPPFGQPGPQKLVLLLTSRQEVGPWMTATYGLSTADFKTLWLR